MHTVMNSNHIYRIPEGTGIIHQDDLSGHVGEMIEIPSSVQKIEEGSFAHGKEPMRIRFTGNSFYSYTDHFLIEKHTDRLITYTDNASVITVPSSVHAIGSWAFYECSPDQILFSSPVSDIHPEAFTTCRISEAVFPFWNARLFFPQKDIRLRQYLLEGFGLNGMFDFARYDEGISAGYVEPERIREITARLKWPYSLSNEISDDYHHVLEGNLKDVLTVLASVRDTETIRWLCDIEMINETNKEEVLSLLHTCPQLDAYADLSRYMADKNSSYDFSI